jgi:hypothetical protein
MVAMVGSLGNFTAHRVAWSLWLVSVVLLAIGVPLGETAGFGIRGLVESATYATAGAIVASRRSGNPIGWLFCSLGVVVAFEFVGSEYVNQAYFLAPGFPRLDWVAWATETSTQLSIPLTVFVFLLFPHGHLLSSRWRVAAWITAAAGLVAALTTVLLATGPSGRPPLDEAAFDSEGLQLTEVLFASDALLGALVIASGFSVVLRQRRAVGDERQQLKWFTYAVGIVVAAAVISIAVTGGDAGLALWVTPAVPIAAALAILKYRLYDIDIIINRTLVYGALTAVLALVYVAGVAGVGGLVRAATGQDKNNVVIAASTLAVAALFRPARSRVQAFIDRRFYRRKYDAARTLELFSTRLREEIDLESLTTELLEVVQDTMEPARISLWLRGSDGRTGQPA